MRKKQEKKSYEYILAIDIGGATRNGVALFNNKTKQLVEYKTVRRIDAKTNLEHRMNLVNAIKEINNKYPIDIMIFESIRLFSYGHIQLPTILSLEKVHTTLINEFSDKFDIYQVDVRSWKAKVLGTAKADKITSVNYVKKLYPDINIIDEIVKPKKHEIVLEINHDLCDAIAISHLLIYDYDCLLDKNKLNYK